MEWNAVLGSSIQEGLGDTGVMDKGEKEIGASVS